MTNNEGMYTQANKDLLVAAFFCVMPCIVMFAGS